jgi:hypothetical protein
VTYHGPMDALPAPKDAVDQQQRDRRKYRVLTAQAIARPMMLSEGHYLRTLGETRSRGWSARNNRDSPRDEPDRLFQCYAAELLECDRFGPKHFQLLRDAVEEMTGRDAGTLDDPNLFERIGTRALIKAAANDHLIAGSHPELRDSLHLRAGEEAIWIEPVERIELSTRAIVVSTGGKITFEPVKGASVSQEAILATTTPLPQEVGRVLGAPCS